MASEKQRQKQLAELRAAFDIADKDGSGSIDLHELRQVLRALGQFPTPVELAELMERMDANRNGVVEFEEFAEAMMGAAADEEAERQLREVQEVFALFDVDGSGSLSAEEVQRSLRILGVSLTAAETQLLVSEIDANGDGEISCDELLQYVLSMDDEESDEEQGHASHTGGFGLLTCVRDPCRSRGSEAPGRPPPA
ncbi:hypothetical protein ABPG77_000139 [Micractinium sp. CCAP 211/92]